MFLFHFFIISQFLKLFFNNPQILFFKQLQNRFRLLIHLTYLITELFFFYKYKNYYSFLIGFNSQILINSQNIIFYFLQMMFIYSNFNSGTIYSLHYSQTSIHLYFIFIRFDFIYCYNLTYLKYVIFYLFNLNHQFFHSNSLP